MQKENQDKARIDLTRIAIIALVGIAVSLDVFVEMGRQIAPDAVAKFFCSVRPFGLLSWPLIKSSWFDYVNQQCANHATEPAVSIISFMIKTSLAIICTAILIVGVAASSSQSVGDPRTNEVDVNEQEIAAKRLKTNSTYVLGFVVVMLLCWAMFVYAPPQQFHFWITSKIIEDGFLVMLIVAGLCGWAFIDALARWMTLRIGRRQP